MKAKLFVFQLPKQNRGNFFHQIDYLQENTINLLSASCKNVDLPAGNFFIILTLNVELGYNSFTPSQVC